MFELLWKTSCTHDKITPNMTAGYCPDCGDYIQNHWYITRCECCGVKQKTLVKNGKITAYERYCRNCGKNVFKVEELESIDIVNINYAAVQKQVVQTFRKNFIQTWIEQNSYTPIKLLPSY